MPGIQSIWRLCDELEKQPAALLRRPFIPAPSWVQLIVASQRGAGECILGSVRPCPTADRHGDQSSYAGIENYVGLT